VLIMYMTGLSIGVHLLNLLCLPAIGLVYYYRRFPDANLKGSLIALCLSVAILVAVLYGVVPGIITVGGWFELFFVNTLGMPFNTGEIIYIILLISCVIWAVYETQTQRHSDTVQNLAFLLAFGMLGIPFYGWGWSAFIIGVVALAVVWFVLNLLPYYKNAPKEGVNEASPIFPEGYKIGFLNRKNKEDNMNKCLSGCVYGDGRLNYEVNHLMGHYFSAMDKTLSQHITAITPNGNQDLRYGSTENGMNWDSPRIGIFSANNRTYMCFEDGADCNFSDMIIEINKGTEIIEETMAPSPEAAAYTMCFEDRLEDADYDMNDLVIQAIRVSETKIQLAIVACGGYDKLQIQGLGNAYLCSKEVHQFFGYEAGETFINTERNKQWLNPVSEVITVDKSKRIEDVLKQISVRNLTTGKVIALPKAGEPPYAIIVPINFRYPLEGHNITKAYANFLAWAQDLNQSENWYLFNDAEETFPDMFTNR